jgi:transaldolase
VGQCGDEGSALLRCALCLELIGPDVVNTTPEQTLRAFADHGTVARTLDADPAQAQQTRADAAAAGIELSRITASSSGKASNPSVTPTTGFWTASKAN